MSKLYKGKINLVQINKEWLFKSEKGNIYCDVDIWINDEPDQYGNSMSIQQQGKKQEDGTFAKGIYIGNAKSREDKPQEQVIQESKWVDPDLGF